MQFKSTSAHRADSGFAEFWQLYVSQHQRTLNQALHVAGTLGGLACLVLAYRLSWIWLLAVLPVGYGGPWLGHFLVERNRPLTLTHPVWSLMADARMVALLITGHRLPRPVPAGDQPVST